MKTTFLVMTATVLPFGFVVLAIVALCSLLAKRRQARADGLQILSVPTRADRLALLHRCNLQLARCR